MRAIALVAFLLLSVVSDLSRPHLHPAPNAGRTECALCNYRLNPHEQPIALAASPILVLRVEEAVVVVELAPRAERCLARAPKQGPPAA